MRRARSALLAMLLLVPGAVSGQVAVAEASVTGSTSSSGSAPTRASLA